MKKILITVILLAGLLLLSGCWVYGQGQTVGYVYAVDDGAFWDIVWYKSSLESSQSDCYLLQNDEKRLKMGQKAREIAVEKFSWKTIAQKFIDKYERFATYPKNNNIKK